MNNMTGVDSDFISIESMFVRLVAKIFTHVGEHEKNLDGIISSNEAIKSKQQQYNRILLQTSNYC